MLETVSILFAKLHFVCAAVCLQEIVKEITIIEKEINDCHDRSRQLLADARRFLSEADIAYSAVERELSRLDAAVRNIQPFVENLEEENARLRPLVDQAMEHARNLKQQADRLDRFVEYFAPHN